MKQWLKRAGAVAISLLFLTGTAMAATISVSQTDLPQLSGKWSGKALQFRKGSTKPVDSRRVRLNIRSTSGKFDLQGVAKWNTGIRFKGGKLVMDYAFKARAFTVSRKGSVMTLTLQYASKWQGQPRTIKVTLTK